jgi:hypothetical protein
VTTKLAHQTQKAAGIGNGMRTATVVAVSPLTLSVNGGEFSSGVGVLGPYLPAVGDVVAVFRQDSSWLVLGPTGVSLGPQPRAVDTGSVSVSVSAVATVAVAVTFNFTFSAAPVVTTNVTAGAGVARTWFSQAISITTTGFLLRVSDGSGTPNTWSGPVDWVATARS